MKTCFMDKSYVVAAVFVTKDLNLRESFVTLEEVNAICSLMQKQYNSRNLNVCITDSIDRDYFKVSENIITLNKDKNVDLRSIEQRYQGYLANLDILLILWNKDFILQSLRKLRES